MSRRSSNQSGFGLVELSIIMVAVVVIGFGGFLAYQREHKNTATDIATNSAHISPKQITTNSARATKYLVIKEWNVEVPLSPTISDAYYVVPIGISNDPDGLPSGVSLGLSSLNSSCGTVTSAVQDNGNSLAELVRVAPTATDPGTGELYTTELPNGAVINGYYYGYADATLKDKTCAPTATLQAINMAFTAAVKAMTPTKYMDITQWGVELPLSSSISDAYYIPSNSSVGSDGITNQIYLGLSSLDSDSCTAAGSNQGLDSAIGVLFRSKLRDIDPVTNVAYTQEYPNGIRIGGYYYAYQDSVDSDSTCKAPEAIAQSINSAFTKAVEKMTADSVIQ
jgi:hypothetical protein